MSSQIMDYILVKCHFHKGIWYLPDLLLGGAAVQINIQYGCHALERDQLFNTGGDQELWSKM